MATRRLKVRLGKLVGELSKAGRGKRGPMSQIARGIGRIAELRTQNQKFVMHKLETVHTQPTHN